VGGGHWPLRPWAEIRHRRHKSSQDLKVVQELFQLPFNIFNDMPLSSRCDMFLRALCCPIPFLHDIRDEPVRSGQI
jgi:hypothetical protein